MNESWAASKAMYHCRCDFSIAAKMNSCTLSMHNAKLKYPEANLMCTSYTPMPPEVNAIPLCRGNFYSCLDLVFSSEHVVDLGQIICARENCLDLTDGAEVLLQVGLFSEQAHLRILLATSHARGIRTYLIVHLRSHGPT